MRIAAGMTIPQKIPKRELSTGRLLPAVQASLLRPPVPDPGEDEAEEGEGVGHEHRGGR
jgi:hypothetical protein